MAENILRGILSYALPREARAATFPAFTRQFPKIVTKEGRRELARAGLLDEKGRMYVGKLEPEAFEALARRYKPITDNNVCISRHAADNRLSYDNVDPEELGKWIEDMLDSSQTRPVKNFPAKFRDPNHAEWMLVKKRNANYTAAPVRAGDFGDIELQTVFEPVGWKREYLDQGGWGGAPHLPSLYTQTQLSGQSNTQPSDFLLSAYPEGHQVNPLPGEVNQKQRAGEPAANGGIAPPIPFEEPLEANPFIDPISMLTAGFGVPGLVKKGLAMAADPLVSYGMDSFGGLLELFDRAAKQDDDGAAERFARNAGNSIGGD